MRMVLRLSSKVHQVFRPRHDKILPEFFATPPQSVTFVIRLPALRTADLRFSPTRSFMRIRVRGYLPIKNSLTRRLFLIGAQSGTRTRKVVRPRDFKSLVYTIPPSAQIVNVVVFSNFANQAFRLFVKLKGGIIDDLIGEQKVPSLFASRLKLIPTWRHVWELNPFKSFCRASRNRSVNAPPPIIAENISKLVYYFAFCIKSNKVFFATAPTVDPTTLPSLYIMNVGRPLTPSA